MTQTRKATFYAIVIISGLDIQFQTKRGYFTEEFLSRNIEDAILYNNNKEYMEELIKEFYKYKILRVEAEFKI